MWLIKGLGLGGAEMLLPLSLPHVDRSRFSCHVAYTLPWKDALVSQLAEYGAPVTCLSSGRHGDPLALSRLVSYVRKHRIQLIHAHLPYAGILARMTGRITDIPVVYTEHNVWGRLNPWIRWANRVTYGLNDRVIAVSAEVAASMHGVDRSRIRIVLNGIDCERLAATPDDSALVRKEFGIPDGGFVVGNVANLTPKKNHENLIDAFAELARSVPDSTLLVVGQPAGRDTLLQQRAERLGIARQVVLAGARNDVPRLLRAMDVFAISSDFEGLPVAMLEAMASGLPVVATAVGGIPSVINDGVEGLLVPPRQPAELSAALVRLAVDPALRREMGGQGQRRARKDFDISRMVREVESIYTEVLDERRTA